MMPVKRLLFALIMGGCSGVLNAQDSLHVVRDSAVVKTNIIRQIGRDGANTVSTIAQTYARPFHWQKRDWLRFSGVVVITASAMLADEEVYSLVQGNRPDSYDKFRKIGDVLGKPTYQYPLMFTLWASGVVSRNEWLRDTGLMVIASVTASGIIQTVTKDLVGRSRPQSQRGAFNFKPLGGADYHSFPSGHTMLSLATAWILARRVNFVPLKIVFYALPVVTGASRIYTGAHWLSDILLGSALGVACAESVLRLYPRIKAKHLQSVKLVPSLNGAGLVISL